MNKVNLFTFRGRIRNNRKINSMFEKIGWICLAWMIITNSRRRRWLKCEEFFIHSIRWEDLKPRLIQKIQLRWIAIHFDYTVIVRCWFEPWIHASMHPIHWPYTKCVLLCTLSDRTKSIICSIVTNALTIIIVVNKQLVSLSLNLNGSCGIYFHIRCLFGIFIELNFIYLALNQIFVTFIESNTWWIHLSRSLFGLEILFHFFLLFILCCCLVSFIFHAFDRMFVCKVYTLHWMAQSFNVNDKRPCPTEKNLTMHKDIDLVRWKM